MKDIPQKALYDLLRGLPGKKILVVGDVMVDKYIWGRVERISPEAPIPVVAFEKEGIKAGGAANVAANLRSLGAEVLLAGTVGDDEAGRSLVQELERQGIGAEGLVKDERRQTTVKTRIVAHNQQVVRVDREDRRAVGGEAAEKLREYCVAAVARVDAVLLSDYAKGVLVQDLVSAIVEAARKEKKTVTADPKPQNIERFTGVTLVSPNAGEAVGATGMHAEIHDDAAFARVGEALRQKLKAGAVLITRSEAGMTLVDEQGASHIHSHAVEVYDVTGAGDTVISTLTLGLAAGGSLPASAALANLAAAVVVGEVGVQAITPAQLREAVDRYGADA
jgi:D-beta-D-heptose 7-phosphate kinase/D-beta-D-heptose 1-phosphate adenosyltransferase